MGRKKTTTLVTGSDSAKKAAGKRAEPKLTNARLKELKERAGEVNQLLTLAKISKDSARIIRCREILSDIAPYIPDKWEPTKRLTTTGKIAGQLTKVWGVSEGTISTELRAAWQADQWNLDLDAESAQAWLETPRGRKIQQILDFGYKNYHDQHVKKIKPKKTKRSDQPIPVRRCKQVISAAKMFIKDNVADTANPSDLAEVRDKVKELCQELGILLESESEYCDQLDLEELATAD